MLTEPGAGYWLQVILVDVEALIGFALVFHLLPRVTRWGAPLLFSAFFAVASLQFVTGARSCGCFGSIDLAPALAMFVDLLAVLCLLKWPPSESGCRRFGRFAPSGMFALGFSLALVLFLRALAAAEYPLLIAPERLDVGELVQGTSTEIAVALENPHDEAVTIKGLESSCACLFWRELPWRIPAGAAISPLLILDLRREPGFSGRLSIQCRGRTSVGKTAFIARVKAKVFGAS